MNSFHSEYDKFMERVEPAIDKVLSEIFPQPGDNDADRYDPQP